MTTQFKRFFSTAIFLPAFVVGCGQSTPPGSPRIKTTPVSGVVTVDGKPAEGLEVIGLPDGTGELKRSVSVNADKDGKFAFTTYEANDGLPKGNYTLTFKWEVPGPGAPINNIDKKYADSSKSKHTIKVEEGGKLDLGEIKLTKSWN